MYHALWDRGNLLVIRQCSRRFGPRTLTSPSSAFVPTITQYAVRHILKYMLLISCLPHLRDQNFASVSKRIRVRWPVYSSTPGDCHWSATANGKEFSKLIYTSLFAKSVRKWLYIFGAYGLVTSHARKTIGLFQLLSHPFSVDFSFIFHSIFQYVQKWQQIMLRSCGGLPYLSCQIMFGIVELVIFLWIQFSWKICPV